MVPMIMIDDVFAKKKVLTTIVNKIEFIYAEWKRKKKKRFCKYACAVHAYIPYTHTLADLVVRQFKSQMPTHTHNTAHRCVYEHVAHVTPHYPI